MRVRSRTIALVVCASLVLWIALSVAGVLYAISSSNDVDNSDAVLALNRTEAALRAGQDRVAILASDWAVWDDTYDFVKRPNSAYVQSNLTDTLPSLHVDFMVFSDLSGRVVYYYAIDSQTLRQAALPSDVAQYLSSRPPQLFGTDARKARSGSVSLPSGAYVLAAQPISPSDYSSPPDGVFIAGYRIASKELADIRKLTLAPVAVYSTLATSASQVPLARDASQSIVLANPSTTTSFRRLAGLGTQPGPVIRIETPRTAYANSQASVFGVELVVTLFGVLVFALLGFALDLTVLRPVTNLSSAVRDVARSAAESQRVPVKGDDEVSDLAKDINLMLEALEASRDELEYLASHDPLTNLYNRRFFEGELLRELDEQQRIGTSGALLWFDLDHFKEINDSLGHNAGDELLADFGRHLRERSRSYCTIARLGGDEFGMLVPHADRAEAALTATRLIEALSADVFKVGGREVHVSASVGIVIYPNHGARTTDLLARADLAMYDAKAKGGNQVAIYEPNGEQQSDVRSRIAAAERIISALRENRFVLYAQPIRDVSDPSLECYELLLRMRDEHGDLLLPADIIPTAERLGLIRDIDRWVAQQGIALLAAAESLGRDVRFTINMSGCAFTDAGLLETIRTAFRETGASPDRLVIEITETTTIANIEAARTFISELRKIGCLFSLDDFGSGASSFYYLKHLPVDFLKIDGALVRGVMTDEVDARFVDAIVSMCQGMNIRTVAEYVESEALSVAIGKTGVDYVQGYHIGRPAPIETYLGKAMGATFETAPHRADTTPTTHRETKGPRPAPDSRR